MPKLPIKVERNNYKEPEDINKGFHDNDISGLLRKQKRIATISFLLIKSPPKKDFFYY